MMSIKVYKILTITRFEYFSGAHRNSEQTSDLIHCVGINPVCLYTMKPADTSVSCIDLYDAFPTNRHRYQPSVRIASMGASVYDTVLLHEQVVSVEMRSSFLF